jgi:uncharacterized protein
MAETIDVEVAYAERDRQFLRRLTLPRGATIADAIASSNLEAEFAIAVAALATGIWSKPTPRDTVLSAGDRVELYRPLEIDPKEARRRRAASAKPQRD